MVDVHRSLDVNVHSLRFLRRNHRVQLARDVAYEFLPGEAFCDGDSKVFTCDHHLKCVAMETVFSVNDFPTSRGDPEDRHCFLEQETLLSLLSTGWFQEPIRA